MKLRTIATVLSVASQEDIEVTGFCIDSRIVQPGNVFIALAGDRFDGHDYIQAAADKGAAAIICQYPIKGVAIPQLVVPDSIQALGMLATAHRKTLHCPIIALTGSNGKTTVKEMIAAVLPKPAHATVGNLNNHIGAPLSLLQLESQHNYAVFELGANHLGEIAYTVAMVKPDVALINNIAPAHIEGFGSINGVAKAKGEIYQGLSSQGTAIVNADDAYAHFWDDLLTDKKVLRFSVLTSADIYAENIQIDFQGCAKFDLMLPKGSSTIHLKIPGKHNIYNALAAASCCYAAGISIKNITTGLNEFSGVAGRMTYKSGKNQSTVIDDTYNANLQSVLTALEVLSAREGKRIFVFGDMGELGAWTAQHHKEVGAAAKQLGIERLMTCGTYSLSAAQAFGDLAQHYPSQEGLAKDLLACLDANTTVLVKGSRSSAMEKVVDQLVN
jgi:UDP-N-acetylmuramoyl-tripeptide--D-alanyl-D-alanine ligase